MSVPRSSSLIVAVVCATAFFGVLNASAVVVVLPELGRAWALEPEPLAWVMSAFLLTYGVAIPLYGRLSDRYGARRLYLLGLVGFGVGSLACAIAPTYPMLLVARVLQGVGGAAFPGLGMTLATRAVPESRRGLALGAIAATMGVGSAVGPLVGGALAELWSWRSLFAVSALAVVIVPIARAVLPDEPIDRTKRVDVEGAGLLALAISAALVGLASVRSRGVLHPLVLCPGLVVLLATVVLARHQQRVSAPFLPRSLLLDRGYANIVAIGFLASACNLAVLVGIPLLLSTHHGLTPFQVGLVLLPGAIATAVTGVVAGRVTDARGGRGPVLVGASSMAVVMLGLSAAAGRSVAAVAVLGGVLGMGFSLVNTPLSASITRLVQPRLFATALSLNIMGFFVGGSIGTTVFVALATSPSNPVAWAPWGAEQASGDSNAFLVLLPVMLLVVMLARVMPKTH